MTPFALSTIAACRRTGPAPARGHLVIESRAANRLAGLRGPTADEMRRVLRDALGSDPGLDAAVLCAVADGATAYLIRQFHDIWDEWSPSRRAEVAAPLAPRLDGRITWGDAPAVQLGPAACGHAVLANLAAAGDPFLAAWLATGAVFSGYRPVELRSMGPTEHAEPDPGTRFALVQRAIAVRTRTRALGPLRWPAMLGTPPWTAAREARWQHQRFQVRYVAASGPDPVTLDHIVAQLDLGVPVPMYTGGDLGTGLTTALPRHVVLATGHETGVVRIYDPTDARVHHLDRGTLADPGGPLPAFGNWAHLAVVLLVAAGPPAVSRRPGRDRVPRFTP